MAGPTAPQIKITRSKAYVAFNGGGITSRDFLTFEASGEKSLNIYARGAVKYSNVDVSNLLDNRGDSIGRDAEEALSWVRVNIYEFPEE